MKPQFTDSFVRVRKKVKATHGILLVGLPGVGFASKLAVDHLISQLKAERIATIYSPHFPNQVIATNHGNLRPFLLKFYYKKVNGTNIVLLKGDLQPLTVEGQYEVAAKVLQFFQETGGETVFAMAGLVTQNAAEHRNVHISSTHKSELQRLKKVLPVKINSSFIPIVGMAGLVPTLAPLYGLKGSCLLVETTGEPIDAVAAAKLVELVGKMVKAKIPIENLKKKAAVAKANIEKMSRQMQEPYAIPGAAPVEQRDSPSYIR
ncbi:MAG: PAC2 family protein [Candidatus Micrarchaeota archaeon]